MEQYSSVKHYVAYRAAWSDQQGASPDDYPHLCRAHFAPGDRPNPTPCLFPRSTCSNTKLSESPSTAQSLPPNECKILSRSLAFIRQQAVPEPSQAGGEGGDGANKPTPPSTSPAVAVGGGSVRWYGKSRDREKTVVIGHCKLSGLLVPANRCQTSNVRTNY